MPQIEQLFIYPIKSCKGIPLNRARAMERGFEGDRQWMLVDTEGRFLTQRKLAKMALIDVQLEGDLLCVQAPGSGQMVIDDNNDRLDETQSVSIWHDDLESYLYQPRIDQWFSEFLEQPCRLVKRGEALRQVDPEFCEPGRDVSFADGFPYLLTNKASLDELNSRLSQPVSMNHFRPNIVVSHEPAYSEDGWAELATGEVIFGVKKPCARCILTTVDPETGVRNSNREPLNTLTAYRRQDAGVMFGQNLVVEKSGWVEIGENVTIREKTA